MYLKSIMNIDNQNIPRIVERFIPTANSLNQYSIYFTYSNPEWEGLSKYATFSNNNGVSEQAIVTNDIVIIPQSVLSGVHNVSLVTMTLFGINATDRWTTKEIGIYVNQNNFQPVQIIDDPDIWQQYLNKIATLTEEVIESAGNASVSEINAKQFAINADRFATESEQSATNANASANIAKQSAIDSANSATEAKNSVVQLTADLNQEIIDRKNADVLLQENIDKKLSLSGGTMTGVIDMDSFNINNLAPAVLDGQACTFKQLNDAIAGLGTVFNLKGSVATVADLPTSGNTIGDVYYVESQSVGYIWIEDTTGILRWEKFGEAIDLSEYLTKTNLLQATGSTTDNTMSQNAITMALKDKISNIMMNDTLYNVDNNGNVDLGRVGAFDLVVRTQEEFESMYESDTWLDAKSVCFVGDGGTLEFTRDDGVGLKIPQTVMNIQGLNGAKIKVENFVGSATNGGAFFYSTKPNPKEGYWINGLNVEGTGNQCFSFYQCVNITSCTGTGTDSGFSLCDNIINCVGTGTQLNSGVPSNGFFLCNNLFGCIGTSNTFAFNTCKQLVNCTGVGTNDTYYGYGFFYCSDLTSCKGTGIGEINGYGFSGCHYLANCIEGTLSSSTALFHNCDHIFEQAIFDLIIRTQTDFESMYNSPTWLGAKSVCFIGDGGDLEFTRSDGQGVKIPQTVMNIQGLNGATISLMNNSSFSFGYDIKPDAKSNYWIRGLTIKTTQSQSVYQCVNISDCKIVSVGISNGMLAFWECSNIQNCIAPMFYNCDYLTDCEATLESGSAFWQCSYLTHCESIDIFSECNNLIGCVGLRFWQCEGLSDCSASVDYYGSLPSGFGGDILFKECDNLTSCVASIQNKFQTVYGFKSCNNLINCAVTSTNVNNLHGFIECVALSNCSVEEDSTSASGAGYPYGYDSCKQLSNCSATLKKQKTMYGYYNCSDLANCVGLVEANSGMSTSVAYGFSICERLTNCSATVTTAGTGAGHGAIEFYNCSEVSTTAITMNGETYESADGNIDLSDAVMPYEAISQTDYDNLTTYENKLYIITESEV